MILLASLLWGLSYGWSQPLSPAAIYVRCHSQFARHRPPHDDSLLSQVRTGALSAPEACGRLLNEAHFDQDGVVRVPRGREILLTFHAFHSAWFGQRDFIRHTGEFPTYLIYDSNEMGYHLSYNLFADRRYDDIVKSSHSFRAIREGAGDPFLGPSPLSRHNLNSWQLDPFRGSLSAWNPDAIAYGKLVGITPRRGGSPGWFIDPDGRKFEANTSANYGGGILGLPVYLILNTNQGPFAANNENDNHRRVGKSVFSDLMCRSLPAVREGDSTPLVQKNSKLPYRTEAKCMQCHSTMDPISATMRNFMEIRLVNSDASNRSQMRAISHFLPDQPARGYLEEGDPLFDRRAPEGRLYFRSYTGSLVNEPAIGPEGLGKALANTADLYACAASRYFHFMTGVKVNLADFSENNKPLSPKLEKYRNFVLELGRHLRQSQNVKSLIKEIVSSEFYADEAYGLGDE